MAFDALATSFSDKNAAILAQASAVAYQDAAQCRAWATARNFSGAFDFFEKNDTQGFVAESADAILVAFRGTQPGRPMDWFVDANAVQRDWHHGPGEVHGGFAGALDAVWGVTFANGEALPHRLVNRGPRTVWITGHSLGGALAELCAARASFAHSVPIRGVYTFGQPRVGDKTFADAVSARLGSVIFRFVNDKDIVPRVPLFSMRYCHYGSQHFFDHEQELGVAKAAVETLTVALKFAQGAFTLDALGQAVGLLADSVKLKFTGAFTEEHEKAFRAEAIRILRRGVENIDDHDMTKHYLARLKTSLS